MYKNKKSALIKSIALFTMISMLCVMLASCGKSSKIPIGNAINYGYTLVDGTDLYYSKTIVSDGDYFSCIFKFDMSTGEDTLISVVEGEDNNVMNAFITLDKGNLYFLSNYLHESYLEASENISYIKPDGKSPADVLTLFDEGEVSCRYMQIMNGVIYYYDDWDEAIYRVNTNGKGKKLICDAEIMSDSIMVVSGSKIYFGEDTMILEVGRNGGTPKIIFDSEEVYEEAYFYIGYLMVDNKFIYYMDDDKTFIGRVSTNGRTNQIIYIAPEDSYIESFNVSDGVVYFVLETDNTYEIMSITPGSENPRIIVDRNNYFAEILPLSIWGNTIYFMALSAYETIMDSDYVWFTVKTSGGNIVPIRPFTVHSDTFIGEYWDGDDLEIDLDDNEEDIDE